MRARLTISAALLVLLLPPFSASQVVRTTVRAIRFEGATHLSPTTLERIAARYRGKPITDDWLVDVSGRVLDAEQELGYFKCLVREKQELVVGKDKRHHAEATVTIIEGDQYRLRQISVTGAKAFLPEVLVEQFPLHPGNIFDTAKIRSGLESVRGLYGVQGFINFTAVPDTQIDDKTLTIDLTIDLDEGAAYRVGKVQVLGLSPQRTQRLLRDFPLEPGDAYRSFDLEGFYRQHRALLPRWAKPETSAFVDQNNQTHIVDITFDFRAWCEKLSIGCHPFETSRSNK